MRDWNEWTVERQEVEQRQTGYRDRQGVETALNERGKDSRDRNKEEMNRTWREGE